MVTQLEVTMTALEDIEEAIETMEASLATDFMTNAVRDIMSTAVQRLKDAKEKLTD
jgi:hypothetical protein|tara:strand:- start:896 stop:1063 length:168 start_codon:yes stop_codon:yes gene_type:complete